jgi:hypothetical protein
VILRIYREINDNLNPEKTDTLISNEDWWEDFVSEGIYFTNRGSFWRNEKDIFINDNDEIFSLFKDREEVAFLDLPRNGYPRFSFFIGAIDIPFLSKAAKLRLLESGGNEINKNLTEQIRFFIPFILRYLYQEENGRYMASKQDGTLLHLKEFDCYSVNDLKVEFTLNGLKATAQRPAIFYQGILLVQSDHIDDTDYLAVELAKRFGDPKGLKQFIGSLFDKVAPDRIERMLHAQNIKDLPDDEKEWFGMANPPPGNQEDTDEKEDQVEESQDETKGEDTEEPIGPAEREDEPIDRGIDEGSESPGDRKKPEETEEAQRRGADTGSGDSTERRKRESASGQSLSGSPYEPEESFSGSGTSERRTEGISDWEPEISPEEAKPQKEDFSPDTVRQRAARASGRRENFDGDDDEQESDGTVSNLSSDAKKAIGWWGEKYAVKCLRDSLTKKYPDGQIEDREDGFSISINGQSKIQVLWLNAFKDTGEGHDIQVIDNGIEEWVEVKSTKTEAKDLFPVTRKQWEKAQELGSRFHIYRIFNVGTDNVRYKDISDPYNLWIEGKLVAYPVSIRL